MKYLKGDSVLYKKGFIVGTILNSAPPIYPFVKESWYEVEWVDGNIGVHPESHLSLNKAANDEIVVLL